MRKTKQDHEALISIGEKMFNRIFDKKLVYVRDKRVALGRSNRSVIADLATKLPNGVELCGDVVLASLVSPTFHAKIKMLKMMQEHGILPILVIARTTDTEAVTLENAGVNFVDTTGRAWISFESASVFIKIRTAPEVAAPPKGRPRDITKGTAAKILEHLTIHGAFTAGLNAFARELNVSPPTLLEQVRKLKEDGYLLPDAETFKLSNEGKKLSGKREYARRLREGRTEKGLVRNE